MKHCMKFLLVLLSSMFFQLTGLHAQGNSTLLTIIPPSNGNALNYNKNFDLQFKLYFNPSICGTIGMELTVPTNLNTSQIVGVSVDNSTIPVIGNTVDNGNNTKTISITFDNQPPATTISWVNKSVTLADFYTAPSGCAPEQLNIHAKLISTNSNNIGCEPVEDDRVLQVIDVDPLQGFVYKAGDHGSINEDPFFVDFVVYKNNPTSSLYSDIDFSFNIGTSQLVPIKVTALSIGDYQSGGTGSFNVESLPFQYNGNIITFKSQNLTPLTYRALYYRVYFDVAACASSTFSFNPQVSAIPKLLCNPIAIVPPLLFQTSQPITCLDDTPRLIKPFLNIFSESYNGSCLDCTQGRILLEVDNMANANGFQNLDLIIDVPDHIYIKSIIDVSAGSLNIRPSSISYQVCGSDQWIPLTNYSLPGGIHVDHFKYSYLSFPASRASDIQFTYEGSLTDCHGNVLPYIPNTTLHTRFESGALTMTSKDVPAYVNLSCITAGLTEKGEINPSTFLFTNPGPAVPPSSAEVKMLNQDEHYVILELYYFKGKLSNFSFDYLLNNNMVFSSNEIMAWVSDQRQSSFSLNNFQGIDVAKSTYSQQLSDFSYAIQGNTLALRNINLDNPCRGAVTNKTIYFMVKVKPSSRPLAGVIVNNFDLKGTPGISIYKSSFKFFDNFSTNVSLFVDCDSISQLQNSNLRVGQPFSYNYVFNNIGNQTLKEIALVGTLPYIGDKQIFASADRNSEYSIYRDCFVPITATELDADGLVTRPNIPITLDYKTTDVLCPQDFDIAGGASCASWTTTCDNTVKSIRFRTQAGYELPPYSKLLINVGYNIPGGIALGKTAKHEFISTATYVNANGVDSKTDYLLSNTVSITTASRSSCEPPVFECKECVTSFSPVPGKKYLLSAWVKEYYLDKAPETYKNSGIRLIFNDGEFVLPLVKASGPIIDGWQRIESSFTVPIGAVAIEIELVNQNAADNVYFDDIRIHPFQSNMKSFVYNPSTQKLTAELDENNYATLYEYDDEGILIRVKKETERGVMTIKETRMNQSKINSGSGQ